jgi:hypothetical protein
MVVTGLYTFFGLRLLYIAWMADAHSTPQKELEEVSIFLCFSSLLSFTFFLIEVLIFLLNFFWIEVPRLRMICGDIQVNVTTSSLKRHGRAGSLYSNVLPRNTSH